MPGGLEPTLTSYLPCMERKESLMSLIKLRNKTDNFERAKVDKFKVGSLDFTAGLYSRFNVTVTPSYELGWGHEHVMLISSV